MLSMLTLASACEHKDLCYTHPHLVKIRVEFDWSNIPDEMRPEGMRVQFFSANEKSDVVTYDFPDGKGRVIELSQNDYHVISYNYDVEGVNWKNTNSYFNYLGECSSAKFDNAEVRLPSTLLLGDYLSDVPLKNIPEDEERVVTIVPERMVCRYTYTVSGIRKLDRVSEIQAALSGMSGAIEMAGDKLPENRSELLFLDASVSGDEVVGDFFTFGYCNSPEQKNIFTLYITNRNGEVSKVSQDVTDQIRSVPVVGHIGDVDLKVNVDFEVPVTPGGGTSGGAGFDVGADEWKDEEYEIIA